MNMLPILDMCVNEIIEYMSILRYIKTCLEMAFLDESM